MSARPIESMKLCMKSSVLLKTQGLRDHIKKEIRNFLDSVASMNNLEGIVAPTEQQLQDYYEERVQQADAEAGRQRIQAIPMNINTFNISNDQCHYNNY